MDRGFAFGVLEALDDPVFQVEVARGLLQLRSGVEEGVVVQDFGWEEIGGLHYWGLLVESRVLSREC
jgi:hypothetical protein